MAKPEDVLVLNDFGLTQRSRTLKSGATKDRYVVTIKSEPLLINTNPKDLSRGPAEAIAEHLRQAIEGITAVASPETLKARDRALKAFIQGKPWAQRSYGGGKLGSMPPARTDRAFNSSGRLAKSIAVGATKDGWTINMAANRADPTTTAGVAGLTRMMARLKELVPAWGDAKELVSVLSVRAAIKTATSEMMKKLSMRAAEDRKRLTGQIVNQVYGLLRMVA